METRKLFKVIPVIMVAIFILSAAGCNKNTPPVEQTPPTVTGDTSTAVVTPAPPEKYHIGVVTLSASGNDDEYWGAEALVKEHGAVKDGGIVTHIVLPDGYANEQEKVISDIAGLADDPLMKAVIVNVAVHGTAAGFQKIRAAGRDDILLLAVRPHKDPNIISAVANVIVNEDNIMRGYYEIVRAKNMGAKKFVFMSFPRHMGIYDLARKRAIFEEACKDLGLEFVFVTVPDPASEIGGSDAMQEVYDMMPQLIEQHGKDAVYFTTSASLHEPLIKRVLELGAMYISSDYMTPYIGYPAALGLDTLNIAYNFPAMVAKFEEAVIAKGGGERMGIYAYPFSYTVAEALFNLAQDMIARNAKTATSDEVAAVFSKLTPDCGWKALIYADADTNKKIDNYYYLAQEVYIFGQGYTDVMKEEIPAKYYDIR